MNKQFKYLSAIILVTGIGAGCHSIARYPIDDQYTVKKIDSSLLGIWKTVEDTSKKNFILVQDGYSTRHDYKLTESQIKAAFDKLANDGKYYITYMNRGGTNPGYQQCDAVLSDIDGSKFLTERSYGYLPPEIVAHRNSDGYFFIRLVHMNNAKDTLVTAIVADTTLWYLANSKEVGHRIAANRNKATFYSDTMHWYKISSYHYSMNGSKSIANPQ